MKRIVIILALAMISSGAFAQFNKGRYLVGGSFGITALTNKSKANSTTTTNYHDTGFSLAPNAGYFIIDNLAVGAGLGLSTFSTKFTGNNAGKNNTTSISLSPFVRYYLSQGIFFQGQFGFGSLKDKTKDGATNTTTTTKYSTSNWSLGAGYAYFLNDYVAVEPTIGWQSNTVGRNNPDTKSINTGLFIRVGFQVYLGARN